MITMKCNTYTEKEIDKMLFLLSEMQEKLCSAADETVSCAGIYGLSACDDCPYKHLCYDLNKTEAYLEGVKERRGE